MEESLVLVANRSGRLWSDDPASWERKLAGTDCDLCERGHQAGVLLQTDDTWISLWPEAPLPGYVCAISKAHVIEPFELDEDASVRFWLDCMAVARGITSVIRPVKMNYEIHGNTDPHLHMHLFPRTPGDVYVGYPNHCRETFTRTPAALDQLASGIRDALGSRSV